MSITLAGYIAAVFFFVAVWLDRSRLYPLSFAFASFSATAVANFGGSNGYVGMALPTALGVAAVANTLLTLRVPIAPGTNGLSKSASLIAFGAACIASIAWLWLRPDALVLLNSEGGYFRQIDVAFDQRNLTQTIYVIVGLFITWAITQFGRVEKGEVSHKLCRAYILGSSISCILAIWQMFHAESYPAFLFNSSLHESAGGFTQELSGSIYRACGPALEPSIFAHSVIVSCFMILDALLLSEKRVVGGRFGYSVLLLHLMVLCISSSATGYIGLAMFFAYAGWNLRNMAKLLGGISALLMLTVLALLYFSLFSPDVLAGYQELVFTKVESHSAIERWSQVSTAWQGFLFSPLFGAGWGSLHPTDLAAFTLGSIGVFGGMAFVFLVVTYLPGRHLTPHFGMVQIARCALIVQLLVFAVGGFAFYLTNFWLLLGLCAVAEIEARRRRGCDDVTAMRRVDRRVMPLLGSRLPGNRPRRVIQRSASTGD